MQELRADIKELKADIKELVKQGAVHNELLKTHEARSLALQAEQKDQARRMEPLQRHVDFLNSLGKVAISVLAGLITYAIAHHFL